MYIYYHAFDCVSSEKQLFQKIVVCVHYRIIVPNKLFYYITRIIKYIDEPCFIGADGVKLLKVFNKNFYPKYVYYSFPANPVSLGYRRHFKYFKEKYIKECGLETQYAIVKELDNGESAISIAKERLLALDELVKSRFISREIV